MINPTESAERKPSSSEHQPQEKNSLQNSLGAQERTSQNESNMAQSEKSTDEEDKMKMSHGGNDQEKIGQNKNNVTQAEGDAETEGSGGDNMKGQADLENDGGQNESNVTQSEKSTDDGDTMKMSQGGDDQAKIGQNKNNVTQAEGDAETEGSGADNMKGQADLENEGRQNEQNVTQTDHQGEESGATGGGSSSSILGTKRGRDRDPIDVGSSSGSKASKKGKLDVPSCAPTCYVCKKTFASWKAVFGHLRAHQRQTPGAFPPPTFTPEGSPERNNGDKTLKEQLAPTLLNLARETIQKMIQDSNTTDAAEAASSPRRGLDIDLNEPRTNVLLDLNYPPPPEKEDGDKS
ncbi:uncharacterized protein DDB_G0290685-like [Durio zibethinus]|uniref:Uncharacterized protein DDB_G0290685-like n=1 Tax=Durio zibethinus TaxID=66656 RepID=A0A6P6BAP4_DURZI|nr:uncharacterized protein DDB_G0290685-like [Durio zibethinus]